MNVCRLWLLITLLVALPGCTSGPALNAHIETLNNEYRQLEDQYYALEGENQQLSLEVKRLERQIEKLGGDPDNVGTMMQPTPRRPSRPNIDLQPPMIELPDNSPPGDAPSIDPPFTPAPMREPPGPSLAPPPAVMPAPSSLRKPAAEAPAEPAEDLPMPPKLPETPSAPEPIDPRVTHVHLNPTLTGGNDFDQQPGDDGLSILIEPRNRRDQYVPQAGAISVVVIDPAQTGAASRIARWDFDLTATQQKLKNSSAADGIHLQLPWPAKAPEHNRLKLYVRYETADGRKLQTDREIFVALPGEVSQRWTPRAPTSSVASPKQPSAPAAVANKEPASPPTKEPAASAKAKLIVPPPALGELPAEVNRSPGRSPYR